MSRAATCTAIASSNWSLASTWSCGAAPGCNDIIVIPSGYTVSITTAISITGGGCSGTILNISGNLFFSGNASRLDMVSTSTINIYSGGIITTDQPGNNSQKINIGSGSSEWSSNNGNLSGPWVLTNGNSGPNGTLPIQLIDFNGVCVSTGIQLEWSTATEITNDYFLIEKSSDGFIWQVVATVKGNGTTSITHRYSHLDIEKSNNLSYYRLSQVDMTGEKTSYRPIDVSCKTVSNNTMTLYPNPASSELNVLLTYNSSSISGYIKIYNLMGELVMETKVNLTNGSNSYLLPIELSRGTYNLEFSSENSILFNQRLIILN